MNWIEVVLLVLGAGAFVVSFLVSGKSKDEEEARLIDEEIIRDIIDKELSDAKDRVTDVIDETLEYAVEKTERASERISNEKIMAISEYSETVLADVNKAHQEVMFLYDMLNDKHNNIKETVKHVDKTAKEAEEAANAAAIALAAKAKEDAEAKKREQRQAALDREAQENAAREKELARRQMARLILPMQQALPMYNQNDRTDRQALMLNMNRQSAKAIDSAHDELRPFVVKNVEILPADVVSSSDMRPVAEVADVRSVEVYSFADQAPRVERTVKKDILQPTEYSIEINNESNNENENDNENNNDKILRLYEEGMADVDIAKELGLGVGEVKLVINLFRGGV